LEYGYKNAAEETGVAVVYALRNRNSFLSYHDHGIAICSDGFEYEIRLGIIRFIVLVIFVVQQRHA
jgi:hypothetical protein